MPALQHIKSRIGTVGTIKKITKAMELVATAKLMKSKDAAAKVKVYYEQVMEVFQEIISSVKDLSSIVKPTSSTKTLYVLITSDIGLCGGYNSNIVKLAKKEINSSDDVMIVGTKGIAALKDTFKNSENFDHVGDEPNYLVASEITKSIVAKFLAGEVKEIKVIHTEYINSVTYDAKVTKVLPIDSSEKQVKDSIFEFEPSPEEIIINSLPLYVSAIIFGVMVESKVAEMTSRRIAMENSTDNAEELITKLNLDYNRARQAKITQEISEIVAGSERD